MSDRENATATPGSQPGVLLAPGEFARHARLATSAPAAELAPWVERYWSVQWSLPLDGHYRAATAPVPNANITHEYGGVSRHGAPGAGVYVTGVVRRERFDVTMTGTGGVVGIKFTPGGLAAWTGRSVESLTDRVLDGTEVDVRLSGLVGGLRCSAEEAAPVLDASLVAWRPAPDRRADDFAALLELLTRSSEIQSTAQLAAAAGLSSRSVQRLFRHYVGVGPKWLVTRARLHDALACIHEGYDGPLGELAARLGWFDQAHFIADFKALVGCTPGEYRAAQRQATGRQAPA